MSKRSIRFSYNNLSPRNVDQIQKGPLKIGNLVDTLNNPSYHNISLQSQAKIDLKSGNIKQIEEKTKDSIEFSPDKQQQSIMEQLNSFDNHQKKLIVIQDPQQQDYRPVEPNPEKKLPQINSNQQKNSLPSQKINQKKLQTEQNQHQRIAGMTEFPIQPSKPNKSQTVDNKIYTFNIIPDKQQDKQSCCDCKLLNWGKQTQRTYPISE